MVPGPACEHPGARRRSGRKRRGACAAQPLDTAAAERGARGSRHRHWRGDQLHRLDGPSYGAQACRFVLRRTAAGKRLDRRHHPAHGRSCRAYGFLASRYSGRRIHGGDRRSVFPLHAVSAPQFMTGRRQSKMGMLEAKGLALSYGGAHVFENLDLTLPEGKVTVFIGSNGCGKSTLLRSMARLLKPQQGSVVIDGSDISRMSTKEVARKLAILPQGPQAPEGLSVLQLVKQGRYPYQSWLQQWSGEDEAAVAKALEATGMSELSERSVDSLSGGQRQRAWIAMTLAQQTGIILLDEPTTYLDLTHQIEVLDLLDELNASEKRTVVMVLHDINLACRYADHIVAIKEGSIYAQGAPEQVVSSAMIEEVFGLRCDIMADPLHGTPMCIPHSRSARRLSAAEPEPLFF
ncbi:hypothetical protein BN871_AV_00150 [Paenibacillus sp. P22]|nr:hypothetical protein BN871_AV_00150 [Paenibacillus sp. P22]